MTNHSATQRPAAPWVAQPHPDTPLDAEVQDGAAPDAGQEHEPAAEHADGALPHEFAAASPAAQARTATDRTPAGQNAPARAGEASRAPLRLAESPAPLTPAHAPAATGPVPPWGPTAAAQFDHTPPPQKPTQNPAQDRRPTEHRPVDAPPARRSQLPPPLATQLPPQSTQAQPAAPTPARHSGEINRDMLFRPTKRPPASGWRRMVHRMSGGGVNPGESREDVRRRHLVERVNQPIRGDYKIAVLSLKGGVGKTTTTVSLGSTFAALRGDHVVAIDANPDLGTLAARIHSQTPATVRDLLHDQQRIHRYSDVRAFTSQAPSRLEVLASERDPHKAEAFSETDYREAVTILDNFYNLILTDCGTGLTHSAMRGVLDTADALVLVSSPALDGAQSADATLNWLTAQGYAHLVERTVVVISSARPGSSGININELVEHFASEVRAVTVIPFDTHLAEGSEVDLDRMSPTTRDAFVELAALVAEDFPDAAGRHHGPIRSRAGTRSPGGR